MVAVGAADAFAACAVALRLPGDQLWVGWHWPPFVFTAGESTLAVFGPVWLLGVAQQRLNWSFRWARPLISRSSYGAFMLQGLALIVLAIALRPLPLHAEVKALIVGSRRCCELLRPRPASHQPNPRVRRVL